MFFSLWPFFQFLAHLFCLFALFVLPSSPLKLSFLPYLYKAVFSSCASLLCVANPLPLCLMFALKARCNSDVWFVVTVLVNTSILFKHVGRLTRQASYAHMLETPTLCELVGNHHHHHHQSLWRVCTARMVTLWWKVKGFRMFATVWRVW